MTSSSSTTDSASPRSSITSASTASARSTTTTTSSASTLSSSTNSTPATTPSILSEHTRTKPNWLSTWKEKQRNLIFYSKGVDGCFSGSSLVHTSTGTAKPAKDIQKGDIVLCNAAGATATVQCVLELHVLIGRKPMVAFENGLIITPMHPILWDGEWTFPGDVIPEKDIELDRVFNFVLDTEETVVVNGITCSVLGHQGTATPHPFWGCKGRVMQCMKAVDEDGFERGVVGIVATIRNDQGTVYGFKSVDEREVVV